MFNKRLITILLCVLMITSGLAFSKTIVKASGVSAIGWKQSRGTWYYLNSSGAKEVGWVQSESKWYHLNSSGAMEIGWIKTDGEWYYLNSSGAMVTGWIQIGGQWYYLNSSGAMATGFIQTGDKKYYLYSSGVMALNTIINEYYLGSDGAIQDKSPTAINLNKTRSDLIVGATDNLIANVSPKAAADEAVTWTSSNNAVAVVDNIGKVTAVSLGTTTIIVTTNDGSRTASCTVSVNPVIVATAINLNKTRSDLIVGAVDNLIANVSPKTDEAITWISSNNAIVSVDSKGKVIAISEGTAIITATITGGSSTASCRVSVTGLVVKITGINLSKITDTLKVSGTNILLQGAVDNLTATVTPYNATNKGMVWSSSNIHIVTVDNTGKIKAVNPGTAIVTVMTVDGGRTANCIVTVTKAEIDKVTAVSLNKTRSDLIVGASDTLISTVTPDTGNEAVIWTSSNPAVVMVDNTGKLTALGIGTTTVICITVDGRYTEICNVIVSEKNNLTFAIDIGHNANHDTGAAGIKSEDVCSKEVGTRVMAKLINLGYNVIDCSPIDPISTTDSLQQRCDIANANNADYYVAVHFNAGGGHGSEIYIGSDRIKTKAQQVLNNLANLGYTSRGLYDNSRGLYVLSNTNMPSMLIECAFLDSVSDMDIYSPDAIADAIVNGIITGN